MEHQHNYAVKYLHEGRANGGLSVLECVVDESAVQCSFNLVQDLEVSLNGSQELYGGISLVAQVGVLAANSALSNGDVCFVVLTGRSGNIAVRRKIDGRRGHATDGASKSAIGNVGSVRERENVVGVTASVVTRALNLLLTTTVDYQVARLVHYELFALLDLRGR